jgi:hypothetical protein
MRITRAEGLHALRAPESYLRENHSHPQTYLKHILDIGQNIYNARHFKTTNRGSRQSDEPAKTFKSRDVRPDECVCIKGQ